MVTLAEATYDTPHGPGRIVQRRSSRPWACLVLTHGAGGGIDSPDLALLTARLPRLGVSVVRVEMPWRTAGKRIASAPRILDECFVSLVDHLRPRSPMVVGGRSAGARVACRTGRSLGAVAVVALAFPLHPPGKPERSRADELAGSGLPTHVVQGGRDPFGRPEEFRVGTSFTVLPDADHSLRVPKRAALDQAAADELLIAGVVGFLRTKVPARAG
ncbi:hypothetical protein CLV56_0696 [Mumia flava]|uniref:KANL3/Tex30 alpha/beta hydrolase-like domain-containing protein n=1 Tax=Mumia flava TaxID=1348852 RepID=A0A0B2BP70_9ACTN|nr:alpha/beta family hydrolase [Mumia flava]PJJ56487.1 hypothetical protein CLV56_0696 [Mumia flava]